MFIVIRTFSDYHPGRTNLAEHFFQVNRHSVVRAVSLSHQVTGSKQPLRRFCGGKACLGFSLPQTPLMCEPPALGLPCPTGTLWIILA